MKAMETVPKQEIEYRIRSFQLTLQGHGEGRVRFVRHGLRLEIDEYPILTPRFNQRLEPGMVIVLEPMFAFPGKGIVGLENDYFVTPMGVERLTLT
jgi:Xaa-Pro dipeptidase